MNSYQIPFNKPYLSGNELQYIGDSVQSGKISGDGKYTQKCHEFFSDVYKFNKVLLTTSCTDALEMAAILLNINPGDEVILPSFTFVSTANAFAIRGAKLVFVDSEEQTPNINANNIEALVNHKTKAIVVVHYAGIACDMATVKQISAKYNIPIIEDAAQAIDSYWNNEPLGSIGELGTFSFHETKNIISGEGGMLTVNSKKYEKRAEVIREKGTNRSSFFRGEVDKYGWVDIGSSYLPSDIIAAFLYAQLESLTNIQNRRKLIWNTYYKHLIEHANNNTFTIQNKPEYATNNAHMFYIICKNIEDRSNLINHLKKYGIYAVFHYQSLHASEFYREKHDGRILPQSDFYTNSLLRLPLYYSLEIKEVEFICDKIIEFYA